MSICGIQIISVDNDNIKHNIKDFLMKRRIEQKGKA